MLRPTWTRLLGAAALAVAAVVMLSPTADAGWGHRHYAGYYAGSYWGAYGGYTPYVSVYRPAFYAPAVHSSYYRGGWSPYGYGYSHRAYRRAYYGGISVRVGLYGYGYGGYGYGGYGCCSGCYNPCCGGCSTSVSPCNPIYMQQPSIATPAPVEAAPVEAQPLLTPDPAAPVLPPAPALPPDPAPVPPAPDATIPDLDLPSVLPPTPNDAFNDAGQGDLMLSLNVPADAKVYINGLLTKTPGTHRQYVSRGLAAGYQYTYEVKAEVVRNGQTISDRQVVDVRTGEERELNFDLQYARNESKSTTLVVHVPGDATLTLEGTATKAEGTVRTFQTMGLQAGQQWDSYRVVATVQRNGRPVVQEQTLTLVGGRTQEVSFDFDPPQIAAR